MEKIERKISKKLQELEEMITNKKVEKWLKIQYDCSGEGYV